MKNNMAKIVAENIGKREIVFWGAETDGNQYKEWEKLIQEEIENIKVAFFVDSDLSKCGENIKYHSELFQNKNKYYVIILCKYHAEIYDQLNKYGYDEHKDFIYKNHQPVILKQTYDYQDKYGNEIKGNLPEGGTIIFEGYSSKINIGKNISFNGKIVFQSNCEITIDDNVCIRNDNSWMFSDNSKVNIGKKVRFGAFGKIFVRQNGKLFIGDETTFAENCYFSIGTDTSCNLGKDCMAARDVIFRSHDGHAIFDENKKTNINSTKKVGHKFKIEIGNHVWLGQRASVLYHTCIGDNSIVALGAVVKGKFENNTMIAGIPAKVIKKNINWNRKMVNGNF